jgi:type IV pilus assembly protein PilX
MLVIISLLATFSIRNATSSETVAGNVRTTQLATQAAEIALRYCEDKVEQHMAPTPTYTISPINTVTLQNTVSLAIHKDNNGSLDKWDTTASVANVTNNKLLVIPTTSLGGTATFQRPPECMIETVETIDSNGALSTSTFLVTARGFGPEVSPVDPSTRARPAGTEIWLQSTLEY